MRAAGNHAAGLLFVEVLGEIAAHLRNRALHERPAEHHREVAHERRVLLLEVQVEAVARHGAIGERAPRPVDLALHHTEQGFAEGIAIHASTVRHRCADASCWQ